MKKYLYTLLFMAVALFGASALVSCGSNDDPEPEPKPIPVAENYGKYTAKISEDVFEYFDVTVIIEVDGKKETYTFGEDTKVADMKIPEFEINHLQKNGRVLEIPAFKFDVHPLRITTDIKLSEAGKQKVAKATTEEMDFGIHLNYGECDKNGNFIYLNSQVLDYRGFKGVYVRTLDGFMDYIIDSSFKGKLDYTFK